MISRQALDQARLSGLDCHELVFINGRFAEEYSLTGSLPEGVIVQDLAWAAVCHHALISAHIAQYANATDNPFTALNTAFIQHGGLVYLPPDTVLDTPIHLIFLAGLQNEAFVAHPRNLIILSENARATIIESYIGVDDTRYFTNTVSEISVQNGASLQHYLIQRKAITATTSATWRSDRGGTVRWMHTRLPSADHWRAAIPIPD
jgi:ABC-type transport system involved in Fe-S cluster assembly, permease component